MDATSSKHRRSRAAFERAQKVLVGGVSSPVRAFRSVGGEPMVIERAEGPYLFDVDGNRYIDLVCSWGAILLGHAHPAVIRAACQAAARGVSYGACCPAEAELAEIIVGALPGVERLRLVGSGTEAAMSVIRLARAATGRTRILKFTGCYHGHVDSLLVAAGSGAAAFGVPDSAGIPPEIAATTLLAAYNDLPAVKSVMERHGSETAAVIVEPIAGNMGFVQPDDGFLPGLREMCDRHGSLLIFDEVMTGFRVGWGGVQSLTGVRPDLTCLGKVIGGGMPLAAYGGRKELMELVSPLGPVYQAGTLSGNPVSVATGFATLKLCDAALYEQVSAMTRALAEGIRGAGRACGIAVHSGARGGMWGFAFSPRPVGNFEEARTCDHALYAKFFHAMLDRGVYLPPSGYEAMFVTAAHGPVIEQVLEAAGEAFRSVRP